MSDKSKRTRGATLAYVCVDDAVFERDTTPPADMDLDAMVEEAVGNIIEQCQLEVGLSMVDEVGEA